MKNRIIATRIIDEVVVNIYENKEVRLNIPATMSGSKLQLWKCNNKVEYESFKRLNIENYVERDNDYLHCGELINDDIDN